MRKILKYELILGQNSLGMPSKSKLLSTGFQGVNLFGWFDVDTDNIIANHDFYVATTGQDISDNLIYKSTSMTRDACFVCHVFSGVKI